MRCTKCGGEAATVRERWGVGLSNKSSLIICNNTEIDGTRQKRGNKSVSLCFGEEKPTIITVGSGSIQVFHHGNVIAAQLATPVLHNATQQQMRQRRSATAGFQTELGTFRCLPVAALPVFSQNKNEVCSISTECKVQRAGASTEWCHLLELHDSPHQIWRFAYVCSLSRTVVGFFSLLTCK